MIFSLRMIAMLVLVGSVILQPAVTKAAEQVDIQSQAAILVDAESGKVLYGKHPDDALPAASMTKMMTEYLVWEAVETEGNGINWDTTTQISDYPYSISANSNFSGIGLRQNVDYTVRDLYDAMAIYSDNATTIALAELIAGSEGEFVRMMNAKAEEMGMDKYKFVNATGLNNAHLGDHYPEGTQADDMNLMSPMSTALLAHRLITDYPEALDVSSVPEKKFDGQLMINWNWMLDHDSVNFKQFNYKGIDGLKTGFTEQAGNCFAGTALRDGRRLISVVMNADTKEQRFVDTKELLDYGYNNFKMEEVIAAGYQLEDQKSAPVAKGKEDTVKIGTGEDFMPLPIQKGDKENYTVSYQFDKKLLNDDGELTAPLKKGQEIGTAELVYNGESLGNVLPENDTMTVPLVAQETVEKSNWFMLMLGSIGDFFSGLYSTVKGWF
ncbi:serine hydrolase [Lentibacillus sp. JNUCC-1]|uniref:serine hydrolase n=1 Tax=Lentibacillus sp. JNUCC-1 TaxID=2654513 RepID=UPI0012E880B6|nr:serine hydrolase [Lentibacillus sp. JNUCC-1]